MTFLFCRVPGAHIVVALLLAFGASPGFAHAQHPPAFTNKAAMGPYAAGVRLVEQYDYSRTFQPAIDELGRPYPGERARPIQTLIWYPADKSSRQPMTWGDYVALSDSQVSFGRPRTMPAAADYFKSLIAPSMADPMAGIRDAQPARGRFPVVIYAASFSSWAWENPELGEYLASWGYVVIASPGMGVGQESTHDVAGTEAQARDIAFLVGYAHTLPDADPDRLAVAGFSWGGLSNLYAAARDDRIKALVDLDGSIRYWPGLVKAVGIDPSRMTIPLLYFKSQDLIEQQAAHEVDFKVAAGPSVLNAWTGGDFYSIDMLRMTHPELETIVYRNPNFWRDEFARLLPGDSTRDDGIESYAFMEAYIKAFLDYYLKQRPEGLNFLKAPPAEHGIPPHFIVVEVAARHAPAIRLRALPHRGVGPRVRACGPDLCGRAEKPSRLQAEFERAGGLGQRSGCQRSPCRGDRGGKVRAANGYVGGCLQRPWHGLSGGGQHQ